MKPTECMNQTFLGPSLSAFESPPLPQHDIRGLDDDEPVGGADAALLRRPPQPRQQRPLRHPVHGEGPRRPAAGGDLLQEVEPGDDDGRDAAAASGGDSRAAAADGLPLVAGHAGERPAAASPAGGEQPAHLHGGHGPVEERLLPNPG